MAEHTHIAIALEGVNKFFGQAVRDLTSRSARASSSRSSARAAAARPRRCGCSPVSRTPTGADPAAGRDVTSVCPNRRPVNMVFQHYELFPHMTVFGNVAYGLKLKRVREPELSRRVLEMLKVVASRASRAGARASSRAASSSGSRSPARSSIDPAVLLLDEPLSALDVKLRKQMQIELKAIQHRARDDVRVRHARPGGGACDVRPDRGHEPRAGRADRRARARSTRSRRTPSWPTSWARSTRSSCGSTRSSGGFAVMRAGEGQRVVVAARPERPGRRLTLRVAVRPERVRIGSGRRSRSRRRLTARRNDRRGRLPRDVHAVPCDHRGRPRGCEPTRGRLVTPLEIGSSVIVSWDPEHTSVVSARAAAAVL